MTSADAVAQLRTRRIPHPGPLATVGGALVVVGFYLFLKSGWTELAQATVNGLVTGSYFALGAAGLTLVYGVLRLLNFAHGEFLTLGAYMAVLARTVFDFPLGLALIFAVLATAVFAVTCEGIIWRPMRARGAGMFQLLLMSLGLAFVIRHMIQLVAGTEVRQVGANVTSSIHIGNVHIGRTAFWVVLTAIGVLLALALSLRWTNIGRQVRALSDNRELAATTGINTDFVIMITWIVAGSLAGLAGVVYGASIGVITPNLGFMIVLSLFAAVILGGIGNVYGALAGGMLIGLIQEWSTLIIASNLKVAVSFAVMIFVLIVRPQGIFGRRRTVEQ